MNLVFTIFLGICIILLILTIIGLLKPAVVEILHSIKIKAKSAELFPNLTDFEKFVTWSPWTDVDPSMKMNFSGQKGKIDHRYEWKGNKKVGEGWMQIRGIKANEHLEIELEFGRRNISQIGFSVFAEGEEKLVTWFLSTELGQNPLSRLMGPIMKKYILHDFDKGLNKRKTLLNS